MIMDSLAGVRGLRHVKTRQEDHNLGLLQHGSGDHKDGQPLSPMARLFLEPGSNVYMIAFMGFKTKLQPDAVKPIFMQIFVKHPRFSSLQVEDKESGELKWIATEVDLEQHVIVPEVDPNMEGADQYVEDYISNLTKTNMINSKPLWDIHLLNVKTSDAEAVAIYRIHHSIGDGMSMMALITAHSRQVSDSSALPTFPPMNKESNYRKIGSLRTLVYMLWNTFVAVFMFVLTALFLKDTQTPLKGPPGVEVRPRRIVRRTIDLQDFKLVKNALDCTINDVVLGVTQAALSRYLNRQYGELDKNNRATDLREKKNYLPMHIRLRAAFFFNLRAAKINATLDATEEGMKTSRFGNKIGFVILPFRIGMQDDPLDYIRQAKAVIDRKKASFEPLLTYLFIKLFIKFFGIKAASKFCQKIFCRTTLWFSNVPGPREEISFDGNHQVTFFDSSCYGMPTALLIHVISYSNKISFVLSIDEDTIPDAHSLCDDLEDSLKLIKAAAATAAAVPC